MSAAPAPVRALGFWMCMALVMGNMIGSGVFLLPASLAPFGWNAVAGWGFTIAGALAIALMLARLTRALPGADGPHGFVQAAFGDAPAFLIIWSYWIAVWIGNAAIATAAVSYLSSFAPGIAGVAGLPALLTVALVWLVTLVNLRGGRAAGGFQLVTTLVKLVPLLVVLVIVVLVTARSHGAALAPFPAAGLSAGAITGAAALTLWGMLGFESASLSAAQVIDADRTVPRATLAGAGLTGLLYLIVCSGIALLLPAAIAANSPAPFADFVARYWRSDVAHAVALFAAISAIGALNGLTLVAGALLQSLVRAGDFPASFGITNAAGAPVRAILLSSALTSVILLLNASKSMTGLFTFLILLSTSATLFLYLGVSLASLKLKVGGVIGVFASAFALWTLWGAGIDATGWSSLLLLAGLPVYALMRRRNSRPA